MSSWFPELEMADRSTSLVPALRWYARAMLADPLAADEVVYEVLSTVERLDRQDAESDRRIEAFTITHWLTVNRLRGLAGQVGSSARDDQPKRRNLLWALLTLSEDERAALLLVGIEGLSYADTATVLGTSAQSVLTLISRARQRFAAETADGARLAKDQTIC
jgi:RNA polymerase sigma-70 factor, ECF subfamily